MPNEVLELAAKLKDTGAFALVILILIAGHLRKWVYGWQLEDLRAELQAAKQREDAWRDAYFKRSAQSDEMMALLHEIKDLASANSPPARGRR